MGWLDPIITIPRITMRKFEELVEEMAYLEDPDIELTAWERKEYAEKLCVRILNEFIHQQFKGSTAEVAKMLREKTEQRKSLRA